MDESVGLTEVEQAAEKQNNDASLSVDENLPVSYSIADTAENDFRQVIWGRVYGKLKCMQTYQKGVGPRCEPSEPGDPRKEDCLRSVTVEGQGINNFALASIYVGAQTYCSFDGTLIQPGKMAWDTQHDTSQHETLLRAYANWMHGVNYEQCYCDGRVAVFEFESPSDDDKTEEDDSTKSADAAASRTFSAEAELIELLYGNFFTFGNIVWAKKVGDQTVSMIIGLKAAYIDSALTSNDLLRAIVADGRYVFQNGNISRDFGIGASITYVAGRYKNPDPSTGIPLAENVAYRDVDYVYLKNVSSKFLNERTDFVFDLGAGPTPLDDMTRDMLRRIDPELKFVAVDEILHTYDVDGVRFANDEPFVSMYQQTSDIFNITYNVVFGRTYFGLPVLFDEFNPEHFSFFTEQYLLSEKGEFSTVEFNFYQKPSFFQQRTGRLRNISDFVEENTLVLHYLGQMSDDLAAGYMTKKLYGVYANEFYTAVIGPQIIGVYAGDYVQIDDFIYKVDKVEIDSDVLKTKLYMTKVNSQLYSIVETNSTSYSFENENIEPLPIKLPFDSGEVVFLPIPNVRYKEDVSTSVLFDYKTMYGMKRTDPTKELLGVVRGANKQGRLSVVKEPLIYGTLVHDVTSPRSNWRTDAENEIVINFAEDTIHSKLLPYTKEQVVNNLLYNVLIVNSEIIQFVDYDVVSGNTIRFYNLFRGRRGTDAESQTHAAGTECYFYTPETVRMCETMSGETALWTYEYSAGRFYPKEKVMSPYGVTYIDVARMPVVSYIYQHLYYSPRIQVRLRSTGMAELVRYSANTIDDHRDWRCDTTVTDVSSGQQIVVPNKFIYTNTDTLTSIYGRVQDQISFYITPFNAAERAQFETFTFPINVSLTGHVYVSPSVRLDRAEKHYGTTTRYGLQTDWEGYGA